MTSQVPVQCVACKRLRDGVTCEAFPGGIPARIILGGQDHRTRAKGDHGLRFELADGPEAQKAFASWQRVFGDD